MELPVSLTDSSEEYRVEFSTPLQDYLQPSFAGADNGTDVQFVMGGDGCAVDYGVVDPDEYCQSVPTVTVACYVAGDNQNASAPNDAVVAFPYDATGTTEPDKIVLATKQQVGGVWGLAYSPKRQQVYSSAFLKRHVGLGAGGLGAIYVSDPQYSATQREFLC